MKKTKIDLMQVDSEKEGKNATRDEEKAPSTESAEKKGLLKGKKKLLIGGLMGLILLGGAIGGAGYLGYLSIPGISQAKPPETPKPGPPEIGQILKLSPLVVNLREEGGRNYLKTTIVLEIEEKGWAEEIQARMSILIDVAILTLSDKRMEDLKRSESKDKLKQELLEKMNQCLAPKRIKRIYFDEILYQ